MRSYRNAGNARAAGLKPLRAFSENTFQHIPLCFENSIITYDAPGGGAFGFPPAGVVFPIGTIMSVYAGFLVLKEDR